MTAINNPSNLPQNEQVLSGIQFISGHNEVGDADSSIHESNDGRIRSIIRTAKHAGQSAIIMAELLPVNEALRYGSLGIAQTITSNPLVGAGVLGGSTLLVEGAAALAVADLIASDRSNKALNWINRKIDKHTQYEAKMTPVMLAGVSMTFGSVVAMAAKQRENPSRSAEQNRRFGLFTASWMAGVFAVEGALISEGIENYHDPKTAGVALLGVGGVHASFRWVKQRFNGGKHMGEDNIGTAQPNINDIFELENLGAGTVEVVQGVDLSSEQLEKSLQMYEKYRDSHDEAVKIGLYSEDVKKAIQDPETIFLTYGDDEEKYVMPLLVPAEDLEWYNIELLKRTYGENTKFYYYAHPDIPDNYESQTLVTSIIANKLEDGDVIFMDHYANRSKLEPTEQLLESLANDYSVEGLGGGELHRKADTFIGPVTYGGSEGVQHAPSIFEAYHEMVQKGDIGYDSEKGVALADVFTQEEADRIWEIYQKPFENLSEDHPMYAGFDKDTLFGILNDPEVVKVVNRVDGQITTLCMFVQNFDRCPWFNKEYYQTNYAKYYDTNNILIFPGIVSDENMKGSSYSFKIIDLIAKVLAHRGSETLITFECTEVSRQYIPKIVNAAVNRSKVARTAGFEPPVSTTEYLAIKKKKLS